MFLALAEIRRSLGRFGLLTAAVALLVLLLLFFQAVGGTLALGLTGAVASSSADVLVYDDRARRNPFASVLDAGVAEAVAAVDGVADASPLGIAVVDAVAADGDGLAPVVLVGGDLEGPARPSTVDGGRTPTGTGQALYSGSSLDTAYALGDVVQLAGPGDGQQLEVVGTAADAAFNVQPTFYVPFDSYAGLVGGPPAAGPQPEVPANAIAVTIADGADAQAVATRIGGAVDGVDAVTRAVAVDALPGVSQVTQSFAILDLLLLVVVTITTGVFFLILTVQKAESLVLLRAIGATTRDVVGPLLIQVLAVLLLGAALGTAVTAGLLRAAQDTFGAAVDPSSVATSIALVTALGVLASLGAVRRVLRVDPADAVSGGGL